MKLTQTLFAEGTVVHFSSSFGMWREGVITKVTAPQITVKDKDGAKRIFWRKNRLELKNGIVYFRFAHEVSFNTRGNTDPVEGDLVDLIGTTVDGIKVYHVGQVTKVTATEYTVDIDGEPTRFMKTTHLQRTTDELKWCIVAVITERFDWTETFRRSE